MFHKIAFEVATFAVALGALASAALAEPTKLTGAQMDAVTAGFAVVSNTNGVLIDRYGILYYPQDGGRYYVDSRGGTWTPQDLASDTGIHIGSVSSQAGGVLCHQTVCWDGGFTSRSLKVK